MLFWMTMKNFLLLIFAISLFAAGFVSAAHAHMDTQGPGQQIELSAYQDNNTDNNNTADPLCDLHCGHGHILSYTGQPQTAFPENGGPLFAALSETLVSSPVYGLKRPPRA